VALERYGLGAIITADSKPFVSETGKARNSLTQFVKTANQAPAAVSRMGAAVSRASMVMRQGATQMAAGARQLGAGLRNAALGALPLTVAVGAGIVKAAQFEKQMSAVGAITRANEQDMAKLNKEAKRMGIVSVFSATQAGEAMEHLARAGANADQIIAALGGTMNAAAADSIDLATASNIVAQTVKAMDLQWSDAAHVADVLALTSASANTNITMLGESFKYGAAMAKGLDISLEETSAIFGKLGDAGLKGSIAGTSFVNMMNKIVKPSGKAEAAMEKWGISLEDSNKELKPISTIIHEISTKMDAIPSAAERAAMSVEFFGLRGVKAYNALKIQGKEAIDDLENKLIAASYGIGAAAEAAEKRLDNFLGRLTLFGASVESLSIGLFAPMLKSFTPVVEEMTTGLNNVLFSLDALNDIKAEESKQNAASAQLIAKTANERLQAAGAMENYAKSTRSAIQVLNRMQMSEEDLSRAQIEARKRGVLASFEAESRRRGEMIKTAQLAAANVKTEDQLGDARRKMMDSQIKSMTAARKTEAQKYVDIAFSSAKGAAEAQKWLRQRVLEEALASNKTMTKAEREAMIQSMDNLMMIEAEKAKQADKLRAEIFSIEKLQEIERKHGAAAVQIALGVQDAVNGIIEAWEGLVSNVKEFGKVLESRLGKDGLRSLGKYATYFAIIAAAIVPVALAAYAFSFIIGGLAKAFVGLKMIAVGALTVIKGALAALAAAFWPITLAIVALGVAFAFYRKEGESFGETMTRLWGDIKTAAMDFYNAAKEIIAGFQARWDEVVGGIKERWMALWTSVVSRIENTAAKIKAKFNEIFGHWFQGISEMEISWGAVGGAIVDGIVWVSDALIAVIDLIVSVVTTVAEVIMNVLEGPLEFLVSVIDTIRVNLDSFIEVVADMWNSVKDTFLTVFGEIKAAIAEISAELFGSSEQASTAWAEAGQVVGAAILAILHTVATVIKWVVKGVGHVISTVVHIIKNTIIGVKKVFENVFGGIMQIMEGDFLGGIKRIGIAIFNALTLPIRAALGGLLKLVRKIPYVEEGLKFMGVDINSIQSWLDEGMKYEGESKYEKRQKASETAARKASETLDEKSKEKAVKVDVQSSSPNFAAQIAEKKGLVEAIGDLKTQQKRKAAQQPKVDVGVNLEDKRTLDIKNQMCVDGEGMNVATARHKQEIHDRAGYKSTPWQRRAMLEHGAAPVKRAAG